MQNTFAHAAHDLGLRFFQSICGRVVIAAGNRLFNPADICPNSGSAVDIDRCAPLIPADRLFCRTCICHRRLHSNQFLLESRAFPCLRARLYRRTQDPSTAVTFGRNPDLFVLKLRLTLVDKGRHALTLILQAKL